MGRKNRIIVSIVGIVIVVLGLIGLTYGYFLTRIQGNTNTKSITLDTGIMAVEYFEGNNLVTASNIFPGDSITKTFNVKNTGNVTSDFSIKLENVINTFVNQDDLTWVLKKNGEEISNGIYPVVDRPIFFKDSLEPSIEGICSVENGCLGEYELTITYQNANYDQSDDMGASYEGLIQIDNSIETIKIENADQLKALSRITTYKSLKSNDYNIENDLSILNLDLENKTEKEIIEYVNTASYELTSDVSVDFNRTFGNDFFFGIGNKENIFKGDFYGNDNTITLGNKNNLTFNSLMSSFGFFGQTENSLITDLNVELSSNITGIYNVANQKYGLLNGSATNTTFDNISFNLKDYDFNFIHNENSTYRNTVRMGMLSGVLIDNCIVNNIDFNLENSDMNLTTTYVNDTHTFHLGIISGANDIETDRLTIQNINVNMKNSNLNNVANGKGFVGGLVGWVKLADINNVKFNLNNSTIKATSEKTSSVTEYESIAVGGIVGFASAGSSNTPDTIGDMGVNINNVEFISKNDNVIEVISAKEKLGGGVNAGGLVGIAFNNATISNSVVDITNGTIISERSEENETIASYGAHSGGIIGRLEHTGRINDNVVKGNNLNIIASSTEKNIHSGGIAGIALGPIHRDVIPLENNKVVGNGTTNIKINVITGENENSRIKAGGLTGQTYYIVKNNSVSGVNVGINGLNQTVAYSYLSNYIGDYVPLINQNNSTEYITNPGKSEIINPTINNVTVEENPFVTITNY